MWVPESGSQSGQWGYPPGKLTEGHSRAALGSPKTVVLSAQSTYSTNASSSTHNPKCSSDLDRFASGSIFVCGQRERDKSV